MEKLTGPQRRALDKALAGAFPTPIDLARMVRYGLGISLAEVVGGTTVKDIVFNLIEWTEAEDRTDALLQAAQDCSRNAHLAKIMQEIQGPSAEPLAKLDVAATPPPPARPSGTVTFLFTDIEGSTKLWEQNPISMNR